MDLGESWHRSLKMLCFGLSSSLATTGDAATARTQPGQKLICSQADTVSRLSVFHHEASYRRGFSLARENKN